jgi:hypothetical protein
MKRTQLGILFVFVVLAVSALALAGTASAGWTWDDAALSTGGADTP